MSDTDELNLDDGDAGAIDTATKKPSGLAALLPNLLKFVAIGLGALIFIITVSVITYNILNKGGASQTIVPENSPFLGSRPQYATFTAIGSIRTGTKDPAPYSVVVDMVIGYDLNDNAAATEFTGRLYELRDFVRSFFRSKMAAELQPENEARLKQEIIELLNTRVLNTAKARIILFNQLDVMEM
ncbi:flagellar basal body-associated FliL family protein [Leadbettera azotonutricia]|uniref:Flagellar basal body-associated protein FliL n=1 Tax=Leadbettera azotonutricia (strain ATCC BAA-888 / DSM 13862 / ZAS-9) TaxID=545695 RepID=F5YEV7_LEAAZ|nr:flagellar basal body-associated FliL family protein [Leadbettera azotonutricia]AEF82216.1 flagellar basal body-associated protein FliL [Leadbettera azotonutricia ZAS-9]